MRKHRAKTRTLPARSSTSTTPVDLFLLAGLPNPLHNFGQELIEQLLGPYVKVIATPSPSYDGLLFRQNSIESLLRGSATFSIRRIKNRSEDQRVRPRRISLFYVPAQDDGRLLDAFDFFVFPVPLRELAEYDHLGCQKRHNREAISRSIRGAVEVFHEELIGSVERRIQSRKSSEPLLLPPINFHLQGQRLRGAFRELIHRARSWENPLPEGIFPDEFGYDQLPGFLRYEERQRIFRDARGLVFPCSRSTELHGLPVDIETDADLESLRLLLQSVYRFGAAVAEGLHHDVQRESDLPLEGVRFECSRKGSLFVHGSHASVYPNDYVRSG